MPDYEFDAKSGKQRLRFDVNLFFIFKGPRVNLKSDIRHTDQTPTKYRRETDMAFRRNLPDLGCYLTRRAPLKHLNSAG